LVGQDVWCKYLVYSRVVIKQKNRIIRLHIVIIALSVVVIGCGKKKDYASFFDPPTATDRNMIFESIALDTIDVVIPNTSYAGFDNTHGDRIFFADKYFCWVY